MNIVLITTGQRPELLAQTLDSLYTNAANPDAHHLTLVVDRQDGTPLALPDSPMVNVCIFLAKQGASAARNIGAGSVPSYRRQDHVMFVDDDIYACKDYDYKIDYLLNSIPHVIATGGSHPYNHSEQRISHSVPLVISSVCMAMKWNTFDEAGPWQEPGGAGGSEDYALCMKAKDRGYGFAVTLPEVVLHCGITSSTGKPIVGQQEVMNKNLEMMQLHGLKDVVFG